MPYAFYLFAGDHQYPYDVNFILDKIRDWIKSLKGDKPFDSWVEMYLASIAFSLLALVILSVISILGGSK